MGVVLATSEASGGMGGAMGVVFSGKQWCQRIGRGNGCGFSDVRGLGSNIRGLGGAMGVVLATSEASSGMGGAMGVVFSGKQWCQRIGRGNGCGFSDVRGLGSDVRG